MKTFHICYYPDLEKPVSSSKNVEAENYGSAEQEFIRLYGNYKIIYIKEMEESNKRAA